MNILLINLPIRELDNPSFPLGLGYIAAVLTNAGHNLDILDAAAYRYKKDEILDILKYYTFDVIGIGGIVTLFRPIKYLTDNIKQLYPNVKIIAGGSVVSSIPHLFMSKTKVDVGILSEGEIVVNDVICAFENFNSLTDIPGIIYRDNQGMIKLNPVEEIISNLDNIPFPAYDKFHMYKYLKYPLEWGVKNYSGSRKYLKIVSSRGCPFRCIYCHRNFGQKYRFRSVNNIIDEMKYLNKKYGVTLFNFVDETFTVNQQHTIEFCDTLIKQNLRFHWCCLTRVDLVSKELLQKMKDAGCITVNFGLETGSQKMLDTYNKLVTVSQMEHAVQWSKEVGLALSYTFMIGGPGETRQTVQETIDFCNRLDIFPTFFITTPYPGTILYEQLLKDGKIKNEEEYINRLSVTGDAINLNLNVSGLSDKELLNLRDWAMSEIAKVYYKRHPIEYLSRNIGWLKFVIKSLYNIYRTKGFTAVYHTVCNKLKGKQTDIFMSDNSV